MVAKLAEQARRREFALELGDREGKTRDRRRLIRSSIAPNRAHWEETGGTGGQGKEIRVSMAKFKFAERPEQGPASPASSMDCVEKRTCFGSPRIIRSHSCESFIFRYLLSGSYEPFPVKITQKPQILAPSLRDSRLTTRRTNPRKCPHVIDLDVLRLASWLVLGILLP